MDINSIKKIMDQHYNRVEVPEDLEAKISATIDRLAAQEDAGKKEQNEPVLIKLRSRHTIWRSIAVAASVVLLITLAVFVPVREPAVQLADTYTNVEEAYDETEKVLQYVSSLMNKGKDKVEDLNEFIEINKK
jgi:anti-sigma-K factor RskA